MTSFDHPLRTLHVYSDNNEAIQSLKMRYSPEKGDKWRPMPVARPLISKERVGTVIPMVAREGHLGNIG